RSHLMLTLLLTYISPSLFFFNDTATTDIYTLSLHDALPIYLYLHSHRKTRGRGARHQAGAGGNYARHSECRRGLAARPGRNRNVDRKSTRLNSSHDQISYAVFCLKKKKKKKKNQ